MNPTVAIEKEAMKKTQNVIQNGVLMKAPIPNIDPNIGNINAGMRQYAQAVIVQAVQWEAEDNPKTWSPTLSFRSFSCIISEKMVEKIVSDGTKKYNEPKTALASNPS